MKSQTNITFKPIYEVFYGLFAVIFVIAILSLTSSSYTSMAFYNKDVTDYTDGWSLYVNYEEIERDVTLPKDFTVESKDTITIKNTLPEDITINDYIMILTNYQYVTVRVDNNVIGSYSGSNGLLSTRRPNRGYLLYHLSDSYARHELSITYKTRMPRYSGRIGAISYGDKADLILRLLSRNSLVILSGLITVIFGIFFILYRLTPTNLEASYFYMGLSTLFLGIWYLAQAGVSQAFHSNITMDRAAEFLSLMLISIPTLKFVNQLEEHLYDNVVSVLITIDFILSLIEFVLIFIFGREFPSVVWISHLMLVGTLGFTFISIILVIINHREIFNNIRWYCIGLVALIAGALPSLFNFYLLSSNYSSIIVSSSLLVFLYCCVRFAISSINRDFRNREIAIKESAAKSGFLANMSHEIRTPINAIIGLNSLITKRTRDPKIYAYASDLDTSGKKLLSTVNDILLYSTLESGKLTLVPEIYDTSDLINDIKQEMEDMIKDKPIRFTFTYHPSIPASMYGDISRVKKILMNILRNAYKYTDSGYISLHFSGEIDDDIFNLHAVISDTGCGISPEVVKTLYEPFEHNNDQEGTGLGLPIVKRLITLMGGTISQSSSPGGGSSFYLTIPQKVYTYKPMGLEYEKKGLKSKHKEYLSSVKILFADDNRVNLTIFKGLLSETGIVPDTVSSGKAAIDQAAKTKYNIIFLDYLMPEMNGVETLKAIRCDSHSLSKDTPAVVLTAGVEGQEREMLLSSGFSEYLEKPLEVSRLLRVLDHILGKEDEA